MTSELAQIEVTVMGEAAVVAFQAYGIPYDEFRSEARYRGRPVRPC